jgi:hypothetical protein
MPDYTVKADVDSMLRADNDAAIRSAIGLGQTDAPTFLAQSLTGQSLTGTQATSLVDLATTWLSTTGTPTAIKLNVADTANVPAASNLMDLQVGGVSKFKVNKAGRTMIGNVLDFGTSTLLSWENPFLRTYSPFSCTSLDIGASGNLILANDAAGILAQRNGTAAQAFRVYNAYYGTTADEWLEIDWKTTNGTVKIGANRGATGGARALALSIEGTPVFGLSSNNLASSAWWSIQRNGHLFCNPDNAFDIGASGANRPRNVYVANNIVIGQNDGSSGKITIGIGIAGGLHFGNRGSICASNDGVFTMTNLATSDFSRLQLGGIADTHPAIARDGAGIKFTGAAAGSTSWIKVPAVTVSALPAAATAGVGARAFVNDALTPVFGSAVTGGGAVAVPVYSTGSAWNVG